MIRIPAANKANQYTVIFLHGLGDTGEGWSFLATEAKKFQPSDLSNVNFVFPTAKERAVTLNFNMRINAWYDLKSLDNVYLNEDQENILKSMDIIKNLILNENKVFGTPLSNIILGGFSQGCALSLLFLTLTDLQIGGIIVLSGYYPILNHIKLIKDNLNLVNRHTPVFIGHGKKDNAIKFEYSTATNAFMQELGFTKITYNAYEKLTHSASTEEVADILAWIGGVINGVL